MRYAPPPPMELHRPTGRWRLGLLLASTTALLWGVLPLPLLLVLRDLDPLTLTWYRFLIAALVLGAALGWRGELPELGGLSLRRGLPLLAVATVSLATNYYWFLLGLDQTNAATAQVLIQLAPMLLALGGLFIFGEHFSRLQWLGFAVLIGGFSLFFGDQLRLLAASADRYLFGALTMLGAAVTWAVYGLAQKQLLRWLPSQGIMLCIFGGCTLLFYPVSDPVALLDLDAPGLWLLLFCSLNTVVGYGAFAEALLHWEASRVSAVLSMTPLATLGFLWLAHAFLPDLLEPQPITVLGVLGACVVVVGASMMSLGGGADLSTGESPSEGQVEHLSAGAKRS